jgi:HK97 family phage major capsid protein
MTRIEEIRARLVEIADSIHAIHERSDAENRNTTADEVKSIEDMTAEFDSLEAELKRREKADEISARASTGTGRVTDPTKPGTSLPQARTRAPDGLQNTTLRSREERDRWGFQNLGEFARSVLAWQQNKGQDPRLVSNAALSTYSSEGVGADGGFAVPPEFRSQIQSLVMAEESLLARCDVSPTNSNIVMVPTDEDTVWGTSGGVRVYRRAEAGTMTQSKAALKEVTVRVEELYALVPVTDQLLDDAPMMARQLSTKVGQKMSFAITNEIINGSGAGGQMLGFLNAPCLVTVSKEGSQAAATILAENIDKMWTRMPAEIRGGAVWLANQDCEVALENLHRKVKNVAGTENVGGWPVYTPPGGISDRHYGTLKGRPVIFTEACQTLGTVGDIVLAYLPGYFAPFKAGGIREAMSMHLWFDQGMTAMRWTFRIGGQPWLSAPLTRRNGLNTFSHFVALETR